MDRPIPFDLTRSMVRGMLRDSLDRAHRGISGNREWSVQGFGMLRTYLDKEARFRLNIWDKSLAVPNVSIVHDHPWSFTSWIVSGFMVNQRYRESLYGPLFKWANIVPGPDGGMDRDSGGLVRLDCCMQEHYAPGDSYVQRADEVHASFPEDGCITINDRVRIGADKARVFWPAHTEWVDAKPRPPTIKEFRRILGGLLNEIA